MAERDKLGGTLVGKDSSDDISPVEEISVDGEQIEPTITLNQDYFSKEDFKSGDTGSFTVEYEVKTVVDDEQEKNITFAVKGISNITGSAAKAVDPEMAQLKDSVDKKRESKKDSAFFKGE